MTATATHTHTNSLAPQGPRILVAGEINADLICQGYREFPAPGKETLVDDFAITLGSASAICAAGLARLGNSTAFIGKVGADLWGDYCLEFLARLGVDVSRVEKSPALKTGITISISSHRDRALVTYLGAITALREGDIPDDLLRGFQHVHVSSFFLQEGLRPGLPRLFARATALGLTTSLDSGFDPAEQWAPDLHEVLAHTDVFLPNEVELAAISGCNETKPALEALRNGRTVVAAKLGANGAAALVDGGLVEAPPITVTPVDTTGAGDSFNAGFLHAWLRGMPVATCLRAGTFTGGKSTEAMGGTGGQPDAAMLDAWLRETV
ncbi:MAG: sugar kinase [Bryobacterales bacterium]|nr:sugar kinase [Bryobacterales bacterium]